MVERLGESPLRPPHHVHHSIFPEPTRNGYRSPFLVSRPESAGSTPAASQEVIPLLTNMLRIFSVRAEVVRLPSTAN